VTRTSAWTSRREKTAERDGLLTPVLAVSIAIAIFAVVTQSLVAIGAISLSPSQQLTMWLVAAGLIVLLWIAYMAMQAQARLAGAMVATTAAATAAREAAEARAAKAEENYAEGMAAARRGRAGALDSGARRRLGARGRPGQNARPQGAPCRSLTATRRPIRRPK